MSFKRLTLFSLFAISVFWGGDVSAQSRNRLYMQYIDTYKDLAISHQKKYKIPASITLAQGLLHCSCRTVRLYVMLSYLN